MWSSMNLASCGLRWTWHHVVCDELGIMWSVMNLASCGLWWTWHHVVCDELGIIWSVMNLASCGLWWTWHHVVCDELGIMWSVMNLASCGLWWTWDHVVCDELGIIWSVMNLASCSMCQSLRSREEKEDFSGISALLRKDDGEKFLISGVMIALNGHAGAEVEGFEGVQGWYGFGKRNVEGEMLLEFADSTLDFERKRKVGWSHIDSRTVVGYIFRRKSERKLIMDVKGIHQEPCCYSINCLFCVLGLKEGWRCKMKSVNRWVWKEAETADGSNIRL